MSILRVFLSGIAIESDVVRLISAEISIIFKNVMLSGIHSECWKAKDKDKGSNYEI